MFWKKSKDQQTLFQELGTLSQHIVDAAGKGNDLEVALQGMGIILPMIAESKKQYGLDVKPNTIFARFLLAFQENDFLKMADMTRKMADALNQASDPHLKAILFKFWFLGED